MCACVLKITTTQICLCGFFFFFIKKSLAEVQDLDTKPQRLLLFQL